MKPDEERRKIDGEWVRALRKELGLTQVELSTRLGVSLSTVARWEINFYRPTKLAVNQLLILAAEKEAKA